MSQDHQGSLSTQEPTRPIEMTAEAQAAAREALAIIEGPDATLGVGTKLPSSTGSQPTQPEEAAPDATMALGMDSPARRSGGYAVNPDPQPTRKPFPWLMLGGIAGVAVALGVGGMLFLKPGKSTPSDASPAPQPVAAVEPTAEEVAPALRGPLAKAQGGDAKAMHLLGTMYYNGLNCPQNREEGLKWLRKAAEAGNKAAKSDLERMGQPLPTK